jgi:hypothetical protein
MKINRGDGWVRCVRRVGMEKSKRWGKPPSLYKDEKHKEDEHSKTTSPEDKHSKTTSSEAKLRKIYKYRVGSRDIHGRCAQDHIYSGNRKHSHQKLLDDKKSNHHAYGECPTQRLSVLTPV